MSGAIGYIKEHIAAVLEPQQQRLTFEYVNLPPDMEIGRTPWKNVIAFQAADVRPTLLGCQNIVGCIGITLAAD